MQLCDLDFTVVQILLFIYFACRELQTEAIQDSIDNKWNCKSNMYNNNKVYSWQLRLEATVKSEILE